jgi:hypothetical protein
LFKVEYILICNLKVLFLSDFKETSFEIKIKNYKHKRDNSIDEHDLEMYFCANFEVLGKVEEYELKPNGKQIKVTDENKEEFLR